MATFDRHASKSEQPTTVCDQSMQFPRCGHRSVHLPGPGTVAQAPSTLQRFITVTRLDIPTKRISACCAQPTLYYQLRDHESYLVAVLPPSSRKNPRGHTTARVPRHHGRSECMPCNRYRRDLKPRYSL